jgi:uncharacterized protein YchJ
MAKKKGKDKKKKKLVSPDEVHYVGPLGIARFGNFVSIKNFMNENERQEFMKRAAKSYPDICKKIDQRINKICDLIRFFDPLILLQCGFFNYFEAFRGKKSEFQSDMDTSIAIRMIDYVQSIIVSIPPAEKIDKGFDQAKWDELALEMKKLYSELNLSYHIYHTAYLKSTDENYNEEYDSFYVKAQIHWANVRGSRYMFYNIPHLRDLLSPHNDIVKELFNLSVDEFIKGIEQIQASLSEGLPKVTEELRKFQKTTTEALEKKLPHVKADESLPELMQKVIKENNWQGWQESVFGRFLKFDLFDVQKVAGFPENLLEELSFKPGEDKELFAPGEFVGWPLRLLPVQVRPFLCVNGRHYCFELLNLMDNLYRIMQRLIIRLRPDYKEIWNERQKMISEELPFRLFKILIPNAKVYRSIYHQWATGKDSERNWCETDGLIIFDDHLIIVEIKAGAFTYSPPATDFSAYMASIKELVLKPATQAKRFMEYFHSKDEVMIYNDSHKPVTKLRRDQFRHITACCVTLDQFTSLAAQAEKLQPIGTDLQGFPIWPISVDDLRVYADIFDSPLIFTHFLEERQRAFKSPALRATDELDHLSLYLKHNRYVSHAEDYYEAEPPRWVGYRDDLDKYFHNLRHSPDKAEKPAQMLSPRLAEIIKTLEVQEKPGRCNAASYLLDMDGDTRKKFDSNIQHVLLRQSEKGYIIPLSFFGGINLTIFCEQKGTASRDKLWKREYVLATLFRANDDERMMLSLSFDKYDVIIDAEFEFLRMKDIPEERYSIIEKRSEKQRNNFLQIHLRNSSKERIGRNEICPCGSGKKYKKCCGLTE